MVPSVAQRGSSFKGAGLYYLHDKGKDTDERVAWTVTHNVPTDNPDKALKWMAYTATNAETIKQENGTSRAGAKATGKPVYAYSLAWHPQDQPSREEMEKAAFSSLEKLGLKNHEAVVVCHQDQEHPHVHVITNLVDPQTGKTQAPKMDYTRLSHWAQAHDLEHGRSHCPLREENNAKRYASKAKTQFVKHNEAKHERAAIIQAAHDRSKTGEELRTALAENGFILARGHKGRICVVGEEGKPYNLTRHLQHPDGKGYRAKDTKARLSDVDLKALPTVKEVQANREQEAKERGETERRAKLSEVRSKTRKQNRSRSAKKGERYNLDKGYISKEDIAQGNDREAYRRLQDEKMIDAAIQADQDKDKAEKRAKRREEQEERTDRRKLSAEARQEGRHKQAAKSRTAFRDGGRVGDEFNAEVEDAGSKADNRRIERLIKAKEKAQESGETFTFKRKATNDNMSENKSGQSANFNQKSVDKRTKKQVSKPAADKSKKKGLTAKIRQQKRHRKAAKLRKDIGVEKSLTTKEFNAETKDVTPKDPKPVKKKSRGKGFDMDM